jgi:FkbM family methyltransferase
MEYIAVSLGDMPPFKISKQGGLDYITMLLELNGLPSYEAPLPSVLSDLAANIGGTFYDIGANNGLYSLLIAAANSSVSTYAFEPLASAREALSNNLQLNPLLRDRIVVVPYALSNSTGNKTFYETINDRGLLSTSSSLDEDHARRQGKIKTFNVTSLQLDDWYQNDRNHQLPSFVKIDVEGHEKGVFEGARNVFSSARPIIAVELLGHSDFNYFDEYKFNNKYVDFALGEQEIRPLGASIFVGENWNHLFVPAEKVHLIAGVAARLGLKFTSE